MGYPFHSLSFIAFYFYTYGRRILWTVLGRTKDRVDVSINNGHQAPGHDGDRDGKDQVGNQVFLYQQEIPDISQAFEPQQERMNVDLSQPVGRDRPALADA